MNREYPLLLEFDNYENMLAVANAMADHLESYDRQIFMFNIMDIMTDYDNIQSVQVYGNHGVGGSSCQVSFYEAPAEAHVNDPRILTQEMADELSYGLTFLSDRAGLKVIYENISKSLYSSGGGSVEITHDNASLESLAKIFLLESEQSLVEKRIINNDISKVVSTNNHLQTRRPKMV